MSKTLLITLGFLFAAGVLITISVSGGEETEPAPVVREAINLTLLLDLSDRISPAEHPDQWTRDTAMISVIGKYFREKVKSELYLNSADQFRILVAPQPTGNENALSANLDQLDLDLSSVPAVQKKRETDRFFAGFRPSTNSLYQSAVSEPTFAGADIWRFMAFDLTRYFVPSSPTVKVRNILIILTDGYIQFESRFLAGRPADEHFQSWMSAEKVIRDPRLKAQIANGESGLIPVNLKDQKWEVIVAEFRQKNQLNPSERQILEDYWTNWMKSSKVQRFEMIPGEGSIQSASRQVTNFLNKKGDSFAQERQ
ncbi:MAG: hypothetical protein J0L62_11605 [Bacteroidetes bacterium]|nr:hypothetical protein [Bacteroidota bacterium]